MYWKALKAEAAAAALIAAEGNQNLVEDSVRGLMNFESTRAERRKQAAAPTGVANPATDIWDVARSMLAEFHPDEVSRTPIISVFCTCSDERMCTVFCAHCRCTCGASASIEAEGRSTRRERDEWTPIRRGGSPASRHGHEPRQYSCRRRRGGRGVEGESRISHFRSHLPPV
jgi:hypothetical protein